MTTSTRYNTIRRRLRMTQAEVAEATGYRLGYVSKWGHTGASAVDPPEAAVARLEALLRERALRDLADLDAKAA